MCMWTQASLDISQEYIGNDATTCISCVSSLQIKFKDQSARAPRCACRHESSSGLQRSFRGYYASVWIVFVFVCGCVHVLFIDCLCLPSVSSDHQHATSCVRRLQPIFCWFLGPKKWNCLKITFICLKPPVAARKMYLYYHWIFQSHISAPELMRAPVL